MKTIEQRLDAHRLRMLSHLYQGPSRGMVVSHRQRSRTKQQRWKAFLWLFMFLQIGVVLTLFN